MGRVYEGSQSKKTVFASLSVASLLDQGWTELPGYYARGKNFPKPQVPSSHLGQIEDLTRVFEDRYHFKVLKGILNPGGDKKKAPQKWLQKYLADFVHEEDEKDSLLIVYYAGHGNPGVNGELILTG